MQSISTTATQSRGYGRIGCGDRCCCGIRRYVVLQDQVRSKRGSVSCVMSGPVWFVFIVFGRFLRRRQIPLAFPFGFFVFVAQYWLYYWYYYYWNYYYSHHPCLLCLIFTTTQIIVIARRVRPDQSASLLCRIGSFPLFMCCSCSSSCSYSYR